MSRDLNIFYNLVNDENSTTELLCNLMQYATFRRALFAKLLPGSRFVDSIRYENIDTQYSTGDSGRPDIVVEDSNLCAFIEVKIDENCCRTMYQPKGYLSHLQNKNERYVEKWLAFLVPKGWKHRKSVAEEIRQFESTTPNLTVRTCIFTWDDLIDVLEENDLQRLNEAFADFHQLLVKWYRPEPIKFTYKEIQIMFNKEIPETLTKLDVLIGQLQNKCRAYKACIRYSGRQLCPEEKGIYFQNENGEDVFFFGEWTPFWKAEGFPLCFGVGSEWPNAEKFKGVCIHTKELKGWIMGWIPTEMLAGDKAVDEIWNYLESILEATGIYKVHPTK